MKMNKSFIFYVFCLIFLSSCSEGEKKCQERIRHIERYFQDSNQQLKGHCEETKQTLLKNNDLLQKNLKECKQEHSFLDQSWRSKYESVQKNLNARNEEIARCNANQKGISVVEEQRKSVEQKELSLNEFQVKLNRQEKIIQEEFKRLEEEKRKFSLEKEKYFQSILQTQTNLSSKHVETEQSCAKKIEVARQEADQRCKQLTENIQRIQNQNVDHLIRSQNSWSFFFWIVLGLIILSFLLFGVRWFFWSPQKNTIKHEPENFLKLSGQQTAHEETRSLPSGKSE